MCKKNKAGGCNCCCKPILVRVDELNSKWPCWINFNGSGLTTLTGAISPRLDFSTAGKMIRRDDSGDSTAEFNRGFAAKAVLWAIPFSMEMIVEFDSIYNNGTVSPELAFMIYNIFGGVTYRQFLRFRQLTAGGSGSGNIDSPFSSTVTYTSSGALKVHTRVQYDTDGMTSWIWLNNTAPTLSGGYANGAKVPITMPTGVASNSAWGMYTSSSSPRPNPSDVYQINRLELRKWNHVVDGPLPAPDDPPPP